MRKKKVLVFLLSLFILFLAGSVLAARSVLKAPVIQFKYNAIPGFGRTIGISIFDYGRVYVYSDLKNRKGRYLSFPEKEARQLLDFIVNKQDFFSITPNDVRTFSRNRRVVMDAATTVIWVWCRKGTHEISVYNFDSDTDVRDPAMIRLRRIVRRLEKLRKEMAQKAR